MYSKKKINRLVSTALLISIEIVLFLTPLGYIQLGPISATTLHLPVILAGIIISPQIGGVIGFTFGLISFLRATFAPILTSFVFSPFVTIGNAKGNFWSLIIVFVPRILLGVVAGLLYRYLQKKPKLRFTAPFISVIFATILHTALVMGGIWLFFRDTYAHALNLTQHALVLAIWSIISTNGLMEAIVAVIILPLLIKTLISTTKRMELYEN